MKRKRWLWFAILILIGVLFLLQSIAQADSVNRSVSQGNGFLMYEWTPVHGDSPTIQEKRYAMESGLQIIPSIGRIGGTTFYVIGFGFTPSERIVCKRISPNGRESKLDPQAASPSGVLLFAYEIKRANTNESDAGINRLTCQGMTSGQDQSAAMEALMELTP